MLHWWFTSTFLLYVSIYSTFIFSWFFVLRMNFQIFHSCKMLTQYWHAIKKMLYGWFQSVGLKFYLIGFKNIKINVKLNLHFCGSCIKTLHSLVYITVRVSYALLVIWNNMHVTLKSFKKYYYGDTITGHKLFTPFQC